MLQLGRIDFANKTLQVGRAKSKKGSGRVIPMNADLHELLASQIAWLEDKFGKPQPDWRLFPFSKTRRPIDATRPLTTIKTAWESVKTESKVACRFHETSGTPR